MNNLKNEKGLTLIELLAVILLSSMVFIFAFGILNKSMQNFQKISVENYLRDEADIIMATILKELYTTKKSEIEKVIVENEDSNGVPTDSYIKYKNGEILGFKEDKLYIKSQDNDPYTFNNDDIKLDAINQKSFLKEVPNAENTFAINLVLYSEKKKKSIEFENEISIINDIKEEEAE